MGLAVAVIARTLGAGVQFALAVALGRVLGPADLGTFQTFVSRAAFLGSVLGLGLPTYVMRTVSRLDAARRGDLGAATSLIFRAVRIVFIAGLFSFLAMSIVAERYGGAFDELGNRPIQALALLLAAGTGLAIARLMADAFKGRFLVGVSIALEFVLIPAAMMIAVLIPITFGAPFNVVQIVYVYTAVAGLAGFAGILLWRRDRKLPLGKASNGNVAIGIAPFLAARFWALSLTNVGSATAPFLVLPLVLDEAGLGIFAAPFRVVSLTAVLLSALASYFAPRFSKQYNGGDIRKLRRSFFVSQFVSALVLIPFTTAIIVAPNMVLALFGSGFDGAQRVLVVLAIGQAFNAITGLAGHLLNMINLETANLLIVSTTMVTMIALLVVLGRHNGAVGAAIAVGSATAARSIAQYGLCLIHLRNRPKATRMNSVGVSEL